MILVDSSVLIDYFNGMHTPQVAKLYELSANEAVTTGDLMVCEVLRGIRHERDYRRTREALLALPIVQVVDTEIALLAADQYRFLRRRGVTIRALVDTLIAAFCLTYDHELLHSDRDFDRFEEHLGLKCVH